MIKRIALFVLTNVLIMVTISIVLNVLGVQPWMSAQGINYGSLMAFCLVWGFGGAFISLAISRWMAKRAMGVQVLDPSSVNGELAWLVQSVHNMARASGISKMPEVGVYESPDLNAFATGPTKNRALVAVSTGLLHRMDRKQIEGVLGHEVAHIANGDMVTMTLIQGVVNAFVMFLARIIAFFISQNVREENRHMVQFATTIAVEIALGILGAMVVAWFSRLREFRADKGGARLAGTDSMVAALQGLQRAYGNPQQDEAPAMASLKISGKNKGGLMALLSSHPPLEERIARLSMSA